MTADKTHDDGSKPQLTTTAEPVGAEAEYGTRIDQNVPLWKKFVYHLWDADQHLKSPEVGPPWPQEWGIHTNNLIRNARSFAN